MVALIKFRRTATAWKPLLTEVVMPKRSKSFRRAKYSHAIHLAMSTLLVVLSPSALAIEFGEVVSQSPLSSPLDIAFQVVVDTQDREKSSLPRISIAGDEAYSEFGTPRPAVLDTAFISIQSTGAKLLVHVRTKEDVAEPYIPMIVQIALPSGVVNHRYDLLFDPIKGDAAGTSVHRQATATLSPASLSGVSKSAASVGAADRQSNSEKLIEARNLAKTVAVPDAMPASNLSSNGADFPNSSSPELQIDSTLHSPGAPPSVPAGKAPAVAANVQSEAFALQTSVPSSRSVRLDALARSPHMAPYSLWLYLLIAASLLGGVTQARRSGKLNLVLPTFLLATSRVNVMGQGKRYVSMKSVREKILESAGHRGQLQDSPLRSGVMGGKNIEAGRADEAFRHSDYRIDETRAFLTLPTQATRSETPMSSEAGVEVLDSSEFYDDAAMLLEQTLAREPRRIDLYQKLIEIYVTAGKPAEAERVRRRLHDLHQNSGSAGISAEDWRRILDQVEQLLPQQRGSEEAEIDAALPPNVSAATRNRHYEGIGFDALPGNLQKIKEAYAEFRNDGRVQKIFAEIIEEELGRPTPLQRAEKMSRKLGGAQIYFKREELGLPGSERIINRIGQMLLMRFMGRSNIVTAATSDAGIRAAVSAARVLQMPSIVFAPRGNIDSLDPVLLRLAQKYQVDFVPASGSGDVRREALELWLRNPDHVGYVTGLKAGPDPFPNMVMDFVGLVGLEIRRQLRGIGAQDPAAIVCSALAGFTSIGFVKPYLDKSTVRIIMTNPHAYVTAPAGVPMAASPDGISCKLALREQRWLHASGRVEFLSVEAESTRVARLDCHGMEDFMPEPSDGATVCMGMSIAKTLAAHESLVMLLSSCDR